MIFDHNQNQVLIHDFSDFVIHFVIHMSESNHQFSSFIHSIRTNHKEWSWWNFFIKADAFFLLSCTVFMFFFHILLIWSEVQIMQTSYFISCYQSSQQNMSLLHFQQSWVVMMTLVCQSDHLSRIITDWHETLNELSFQMTIQVHMYRNSFFIWLLIISWIFSQTFLWVIMFSDFMCLSRSYFLTWNHT